MSLAELHVLLADAGIPTSPDLSGVPATRKLGWLEAANVLADWATNHLPMEHAQGDQQLAELAGAIEETLKVDVLVDEFQGDPLSGAAITDRTFPLLFVNASHSRPRSLFTLAHELGHLLAGHSQGISLDRELSGSTEDERVANAFAAQFLLPESEITDALDVGGRTLSNLVSITDRYGVSFETLVYRLHNLRLIDAEVRDRLTSMGWQGLVTKSIPALLSTGMSPSREGSLLVRSQLKPARRPPALLLRRAFEGFQKGIVSVRPLAGLTDVDPTELLNQLADVTDFPSILADFSHDPSVLGGSTETDEELFSGSPV